MSASRQRPEAWERDKRKHAHAVMPGRAIFRQTTPNFHQGICRESVAPVAVVTVLGTYSTAQLEARRGRPPSTSNTTRAQPSECRSASRPQVSSKADEPA